MLLAYCRVFGRTSLARLCRSKRSQKARRLDGAARSGIRHTPAQPGSPIVMTLVRLPDPESARPLAGGAAGAGRMLDFVPIFGQAARGPLTLMRCADLGQIRIYLVLLFYRIRVY